MSRYRRGYETTEEWIFPQSDELGLGRGPSERGAIRARGRRHLQGLLLMLQPGPLLSRLLRFFDDYDHGRVDDGVRLAYQELQARVEIATANMATAENDAEAELHWNGAAQDILRFLQRLDAPTVH